MFSITDYGAIAGGEVLCTAAIQAATDAVRATWRDVLRDEDCAGLEGCVRETR